METVIGERAGCVFGTWLGGFSLGSGSLCHGWRRLWQVRGGSAWIAYEGAVRQFLPVSVFPAVRCGLDGGRGTLAF
ncbi:hypothetical protein SLA2020_057480 [Shorea laevis]